MSTDSGYITLKEVLSAKKKWSGWAVEFGVFSGESLGLISKHMPVIGFDSFQGLPEDWRPEFPKGAFAIPEGPTVADILKTGPNRMVVSGWFEDTVPGFPFPKLDLVHIDCDLYSSTVTSLEGVTPYVGPGTYVVFDEYHGYAGCEDHEEKAWTEWCKKNKVAHSTVAVGPEERAFLIESIKTR